ncbi:glycine cleavage system aminomethyltransferase GcvT [Vulcanibacillus modesticaldus]|uniref:glycine cleavage system aminomethyltransferase GcvT n=1 Tax=Vulcanibacillus modesticaldus TaxID=337097 RepID=UPI000A93C0D1|nr:glycine cleavage system aminomethyltransferase GcvT [Vulcanibacillus modesticaldus]
MVEGLKRTPLYPLYEKYGAKVIDFGGWELPVQFTSILEEHQAVRERAGLFDVSHMGEVEVKGTDALKYIQKLITNDASKLVDGKALYSPMCYPDGGTVDDLLVYRYSENHYLLVINASNIDKDYNWFEENLEGDVTIKNISDQVAQLALQGPLAEKVLQKLTDLDLSTIKFFHFNSDVKLDGIKALVSRTGYTGEDGFEIYLSNEDAPKLWEKILEAGKEENILPCGLGARDTLRFEAKLPLYGQELSENITPIEAGLGFFVKLDKGEFIGRGVLADQKENGAPRKLVGIEMIERGIPRSHYPVYVGEEVIGEVTTGTQSPTLKKNVGLALIKSEYADIGNELFIGIRNKKVKAKVVNTPFYKRGK